MKTSRAWLAVLPLILSACGNGQLEASRTESCGGGSLVDDGGDGPGIEWAGPFDGRFQERKLHVDLATDGRHARLSVDGGQALDLGLVARLYCSDSIGMFGDGPTRVDSKMIVTLFRTAANERSIKVDRWGL